MTFGSIAIPSLFFGDKVILSRVLYDIPVQIPVGLAMKNVFLSRDGKLKTLAIILSLLAIVINVKINIGVQRVSAL